ncbi:MAG: 3-deoxy-D-manno-octulosonate 8-phosphate phosphatase (KDO 8-P phosphatase) [Planctomycetota bacterium]|jgi:3-deoxy-D-manno-octulosonate 8-phosphate phosphatase (KDO 8-P phosphatase)
MSTTNTELDKRLRAVKLVALDVDGVLTDGRVIHGDWSQGGGVELQAFDVTDGAALVWLRRAGLRVVWISGRGCEATKKRAEEVGVDELFVRAGPKDQVLKGIQEAHSVARAETLAMGDDLPDLRMLLRAGIFIAPANARPEVRAQADLITEARGGRGAVREVAERLLRARGEWDALVDSYSRSAE